MVNNAIVTHCFTGFVCAKKSTSHNTPHVGICKDTTVNITVIDTSGTPTTSIKTGPLTTNGSDSVSGLITEQVKYDSESEGRTAGQPTDVDRMTIEACVDASTHSACQPAPTATP